MQEASTGQSRYTSHTQSAADCTHRQGPSVKQWEGVKNVVRQLYLVEHRSLKYVQSKLESEHGFRAS